MISSNLRQSFSKPEFNDFFAKLVQEFIPASLIEDFQTENATFTTEEELEFNRDVGLDLVNMMVVYTAADYHDRSFGTQMALYVKMGVVDLNFVLKSTPALLVAIFQNKEKNIFENTDSHVDLKVTPHGRHTIGMHLVTFGELMNTVEETRQYGDGLRLIGSKFLNAEKSGKPSPFHNN